jgi:hypothetical protein
MYSDGLADATKQAATTGLIVAAATWTILRLKEGSMPVGSLTPTMLNQLSGAMAATLEVTFGAQLAQGVLVNVIQGASDIYQGLKSGNTEQQRKGLRAIGDAGLDTVQLAALGKVIEGWTGRKTSAQERPVGKEPEAHEKRRQGGPSHHQKFVDAKTNPEIIPVKIAPEKMTIAPPQFPKKGGVKTRQQLDTEVDAAALEQASGLPKPPEATKVKVALVNHDYHNPNHPANFKIEVTISRSKQFVVGFDPNKPPPVPDFTGQGPVLPGDAQFISMKKSTYDKVLAAKGAEVDGFRVNSDGIIEKKSAEGAWEPYMQSHWPYGTQK